VNDAAMIDISTRPRSQIMMFLRNQTLDPLKGSHLFPPKILGAVIKVQRYFFHVVDLTMGYFGSDIRHGPPSSVKMRPTSEPQVEDGSEQSGFDHGEHITLCMTRIS